LETGLVVDFNSTNVLNPLAVVITSISLEHTMYWGDTIDKLHLRKQQYQTVCMSFSGVINKQAKEVVSEKCDETQK